ncbi:MAG TPA: hypothetical protein VFS12_12845 [Terriglobia bacterium]|nr:hypothetical protein [Terriglobia bacterium]
MVLAILAAPQLGSSSGAVMEQNYEGITWNFDRPENLGGHNTTVLGQPKVIDSPVGKAVEFDGVDDALFIDNHPLAGAKTLYRGSYLPSRRRTKGAAMVSSQ